MSRIAETDGAGTSCQEGDDGGRVVDKIGKHSEDRGTDGGDEEDVEKEKYSVRRHGPPLDFRVGVEISAPGWTGLKKHTQQQQKQQEENRL